ncbi:hypothetical protein CLROS_042530 [Clostridium felsineum]|uniref:LXG domain-containing protein n=1 Tax=Clostridium felsineum TaxID=36839 RepID=A0A9Q8UGC7_9CLOT|nr:T7SS effector LXG polymorphic toxin [Clostridium felsineum]URZ08859.1 hypothetical protein CLROS_042530 [Clostridium felsineum]URZ09487.1 hypothetical protein CROST_001580 [Clostridium felsineum]
MSNTELYHEQLNELSLRIMGGIKNRMEPLGDLDKALTQLSQTDAIKGNAADAMKAYIREVHMTLNQTLQLLLFNYETAMVKYVNGYLDQVDSDKDFKLIKEDFDAHEHNLSSHRSDFTSFGKKLKAISDEAEDIVSLSGAGSKRIDNVVDEMNKMKETVSNLRDKWNNYEDRYRDFDQVQDLIVQATSLVKNTLSVPRGYSYSPGSFRNLMSKDFIKAFEVNAKYAQDPKNQKALTAGVDRILKNYKADQKRIAEEAKEKAKKEGLIGLIFDYVQIQAGGVIALVGVGLIPFTGGTSISLTVLGCSMVVGGVNSGINHASMAFTGKECNLIGNLTNGAVQWYNKNIGEPLVKTGNPVAQFVAGFGNASIEMVGAMGQFSVYDTGKAVYTLLTNPEAQAQFKAGVGHWWKQVCSGDAYTLGQTTATVLSVVVDPDDVGAAVSKASKAESLLGKMGTFSKSIAISSAENAKNIATLPWRTIDNLGSKVADLRAVLSEGKGAIGDFRKSVVVSSAKNAKSLLTKVKSTVSDVKTVSASFAKAFGKTYAKECRKYVNTCFSASGAVGAGAEAIYKASKDGLKEAKNALRTVKAEKNGLVESPGKPRYGERRISNELYNELRRKTPSRKIQKEINKDIDNIIGTPDPALPGKNITGTLQADHIVSMDNITRMEGFEKLTKKQQLAVLNNLDNFNGLSEAANKSKGAKSFKEWMIYKKENIEVDPKFREKMIAKEQEIEIKIQKQIDDYNRLNGDSD